VTEPLVLSGQAGTITVAAIALDRVVVHAAESVEGVRVRRPKRSVDVAHRAGLASVSFKLAIEQGVPVPELARTVQKRVADAVAATTGVDVERVDVTVAEIA
jgi:uncharacterized alkaline shock family protein YloU